MRGEEDTQIALRTNRVGVPKQIIQTKGIQC